MARTKLCLLLFICSLVCLQSFSQKATLDWVDMTHKTKHVPSIFKVLKGHNDEILIYGRETQTRTGIVPVFIRLDKNMNPVAEKALPVTDSTVLFHSIYNFNDQIFLFTYRIEEKKEIKTLYCTQVDPLSLEVMAEKEIGVFAHTQVYIKPSADSSRILIYAAVPYKKGAKCEFQVSVWDNKMNNLWDKQVVLPYANEVMAIGDFEIFNNGDVFIKCRHYNDILNRERFDPEKEPFYKYKLFACTNNGTAYDEYPIDFGKKFVHDVALHSLGGDNIQLLGVYKNKFDGRVAGSFSTVLNTTTSALSIKKVEAFPVTGFLDLLEKDMVAKAGSKDPGLYGYFRIIGTNQRNDGSFDLLTEYNYMKRDDLFQRKQEANRYQQDMLPFVAPTKEIEVKGGSPELQAEIRRINMSAWREQEMSYRMNEESMIMDQWVNGMSGLPHTIHIANDIVVINFRNDSKIIYTRVPKSQKEEMSGEHLGFKWANRGNTLVLFYNDLKGNLTKDLAKKPDNVTIFPESVVVMAGIDSNGELQRKMAYDNNSLGFATMIRWSELITPNAFILYASEAEAKPPYKPVFTFGCFRLF